MSPSVLRNGLDTREILNYITLASLSDMGTVEEYLIPCTIKSDNNNII